MGLFYASTTGQNLHLICYLYYFCIFRFWFELGTSAGKGGAGKRCKVAALNGIGLNDWTFCASRYRLQKGE